MICNDCPYYELLKILLQSKDSKQPFVEQQKIVEAQQTATQIVTYLEEWRKKEYNRLTNYSQPPYNNDDKSWLTKPKETL